MIEEPPLLGNVTPVPDLSAPGTPEPEAIPGRQAPVADLPSQSTNKKKHTKFHNAPKVSDVRLDDPNWDVIGDDG
eukprot:9352785-Heterocapsa_arctica.AAC.1